MTRHRNRRRPRIILTFLTLPVVAFGLAGCAGSVASTAPSPAETEVEPEPSLEWTALAADPENIIKRVAPETPANPDGFRFRAWPSPSREQLVLEIAWKDSAGLYLVEPDTESAAPVHTSGAETEYSVAWEQSGKSVLVGYRSARLQGIELFNPGTATSRSIGCSASFRAYAVRDDSTLVVGDAGSLYLVKASGCTTISRIDMTKRHHVSVSPDGRHVAYVFRDLVFNRRAYSYDPDSTLFLRSFSSPEEKQITSDRYRARNLAWSPTSDQIAFDARSVDGVQQRQVATYDIETGQAGFALNPGDMTMPIDRRPVWSPSGDAIAFERVDSTNDERQVAVRHFVNRRLYVVAVTDGSDEFRRYRFIGDEHVLIAYESGRSEVRALDGTAVFQLDNGRNLITALRLPITRL